MKGGNGISEEEFTESRRQDAVQGEKRMKVAGRVERRGAG